MKLKLQRETLLKPLQQVIGVVERKQALPILSNVLIHTHENKLSITGTDLEVQLIGQATLEQSDAPSAQVTLPGRKLVDICKALPDSAPIELYQDNERMILKSGRSRFTLSTLPAADFPNVDEHESQISFNIPEKDFYYLLQRTAFAMAQQDVRYYLNGLLLEVSKNALRSVATDGHRLAYNIVDANIKDTHRIQIIIPRKGVLELMRLLSDSDNTISIAISNSHVRITTEEFTFTSKLIEGRFPDYERVIPKDGKKKVLLDRDELKTALSRSAILCNEKFRGVRLEFRQNLLRILANNPEQEVAEEELVIDYDAEDIDIGFNVTYLLDILGILHPGKIQLTFNDSNSSMRLEEPESQGDSIFVIMPMRL